MTLQGEIERIREAPDPPNEEATKFQIIMPILQEVGWDYSDYTRVSPEFPVNKKGDAVDFALLSSRKKPVAFVEAKAAGVRLDGTASGKHETPEIQVLNYAFNAGVDICVLTSGLLWWLYLPREKGEPAERRFAELDIRKDSVEQLCTDFQTYLGFEELTEQQAEAHAKRVLEAKLNSERLKSEIPRVWGSLLADPPQDLLELIQSRVFTEIRLQPSDEQVSQFLRTQSVVEVDIPKGDVPRRKADGQPRKAAVERPGVADGPKVPADESKVRRKRPTNRPSAFRVWGREYPVRKWAEVLVGVAEVLYERHASDFPRMVGRPRGKRSYIETTPAQMKTSRQVGDSRFWVDTNASAETIQKRAAYLLELFGYSPDDLELVFK